MNPIPHRTFVRSTDAPGIQSLPPQSSPVYQLYLNLELFIKILDLLSLKDIHALSGTCKKFKAICIKYYRCHYSTSGVIGLSGVLTQVQESLGVTYGCEIPAFVPFVHRLTFKNDITHQYLTRYRFRSLTEIKLVAVVLEDMESIAEILPTIEVIELIDCSIRIDLYEALLAYCPNLNSLRLKNVNGLDYNWMHESYSDLKHLQLLGCQSIENSDLEHFFDANPKIDSFEANDWFLWKHFDIISPLKSNRLISKWKDLKIHVEPDFESKNPLSVYKLIDMFYQNDRSERFHLISRCNEIEKTRDLYFFQKYVKRGGNVLISFDSLSELQAHCKVFDKMKTSRNFIDLEKIYLANASVSDVFAAVRYCSKLKILKINQLQRFQMDYIGDLGTIYNNADGLNVAKLNDIRSKLYDAEKLTIFVHDALFLTTKWNAKEVNCRFVEIKLITSNEWDDF